MIDASRLYLGVFVLFLILLYVYRRFHSTFRCFFFTLTTGWISLAALWVIGTLAPLSVALTPFSLFVAGSLGIPGVVGMFLLHLI